ncbi:hypothetical protein [Butyrivibrio sp.]|uniref:hypothetical protein n=1 Tax=Butyrivibrio sp. TaxID=28121 RepID=UPI0025C56203|nr:hypothetical protein [Butyrivibrio sp.]MBQ9303463.1 hypothetical protein [Butyrivibrio sp.]
MQAYYFGTAENHCQLYNALIINLNENTRPFPTIEYVTLGEVPDTSWTQMALIALKHEPLDSDAPQCFIDVYDDDKFICHMASKGLIYDYDRHYLALYGITGDAYRRGLIIQDLLRKYPQTNSSEYQYDTQKTIFSPTEKLYGILSDIINNAAVFSIKNADELKQLDDLKVCYTYTLPAHCEEYYQYFTIDKFGFARPQDHRNAVWDKVYAASSLIQLGKQIIDEYAVGFSQIAR